MRVTYLLCARNSAPPEGLSALLEVLGLGDGPSNAVNGPIMYFITSSACASDLDKILIADRAFGNVRDFNVRLSYDVKRADLLWENHLPIALVDRSRVQDGHRSLVVDRKCAKGSSQFQESLLLIVIEPTFLEQATYQ